MVRTLIPMLLLISSGAISSEVHQPADYVQIASYADVPAHLLYAMAQAESGRVVDGEVIPWPWTLNVEGEPHFFSSRDAMFGALMTALQAGRLKVDVGPMQINWYWQYRPETSPWRLTDPATNIKIGAEILRSHYLAHGDWLRAVGQYHRPRELTGADKAIAQAYRARVQKFLAHVVEEGDDASAEK